MLAVHKQVQEILYSIIPNIIIIIISDCTAG
jgi:hypothetical protein